MRAKLGFASAAHVSSQQRFSFPEPRFQIQDIHKAVLGVVNATLADLARDHNSVAACISKVPVELLANVFAELALPDRIAASRVATTWRTAFLTPMVWAEIKCERSRESALAMKQMLSLSARSPLRLDIIMTRHNSEIILDALEGNVSRCLAIDLALEPNISSHDLDRLVGCFSLEMPRLRRFWLHDPGVVGHLLIKDDSNGRQIFNGCVSGLRSVTLCCDMSTLEGIDCPAFANVQNAILFQPGNMEARHLATFFRLFPAVVHTFMRVESYSDDEASDSPLVSLPPSLRSIVLVSDTVASNGFSILKRLRWQHVLRLSMQPKGGMVTEADMLSFFNGTQRHLTRRTAWVDWEDKLSAEAAGIGVSLSMTDDESDMHVLLSRNYHGPEPSISTAERTSFELTAPLPASIFINVTKLYLNELIFDPDMLQHAFPEVVAVEDLKILLTNTHFQRHHIGVSPFVVSQTMLCFVDSGN